MPQVTERQHIEKAHWSDRTKVYFVGDTQKKQSQTQCGHYEIWRRWHRQQDSIPWQYAH